MHEVAGSGGCQPCQGVGWTSRALALATWASILLVAGCGGDPAAGRAGRTIGAGWRGLAEVERTLGGESTEGAAASDPIAGEGGSVAGAGAEAPEGGGGVLRGQPEHARAELRAALASAHQRLRDAEEVVTIWQDTGTGRVGWYTYAPCLAASLARLRDALEAVDLSVPAELHQAETMAEEDATGRCADEHERQLVSPHGPAESGLDAPPPGGN